MEIVAQTREKLGSHTKSLRKEGLIPAVVFGKGMESVTISVKYNDFVKVFSEAGETSLIDIKLPSKAYKILVKDVSYAPVTNRITHIGFYKPDLTEKINAQVPVEITGDEDHPLVKSGEAMVLTLMSEITVKCLPADIPQEFLVDISKITDIEGGITVAELEYDREKVEIEAEEDEMVVKLTHAETEEEEEEVSEEEAMEGIEATEEKETDEDSEEASEGKTE